MLKWYYIGETAVKGANSWQWVNQARSDRQEVAANLSSKGLQWP